MVAQLDRLYWRTAGSKAALRRVVSYLFFEGRPATTRGQWFNPIVAQNLKMGEHLSGRTVEQPIFILGVGRSGTTHLGRLLSSHSEAAWLNEPKLMWNRLLPDEDVSGFYAPRGRFRFTADDATPIIRERATAIVSYYLRCVRSTRLVDKYPEMTYRASFIKALFPDAVIIAIIRRPEDFVNSVLSWNLRKATDREDWWGVNGRKWHHMQEELALGDPEVAAICETFADIPPSPAEKAATEWVLGMRSILSERDHINAEIRYEALALDPRATMVELLKTCGLTEEPQVLALAQQSTSSKLRTETADFGRLAKAIASTRIRLGV